MAGTGDAKPKAAVSRPATRAPRGTSERDNLTPARDSAPDATAKSADAFRTIGEVSEDLGVPKHVLRFWEGRFPQLRPMKRGGGRRFYRPEDVEVVKGIHHLLHTAGFTIRGVQKIIRRDGIDAVKKAPANPMPSLKPPPPSASAPAVASRRQPETTARTRAGIARKVMAELEDCLAILKGEPLAARDAETKARRRSAAR